MNLHPHGILQNGILTRAALLGVAAAATIKMAKTSKKPEASASPRRWVWRLGHRLWICQMVSSPNNVPSPRKHNPRTCPLAQIIWPLMGPYLGWLAFATALNAELLRENSTVGAFVGFLSAEAVCKLSLH